MTTDNTDKDINPAGSRAQTIAQYGLQGPFPEYYCFWELLNEEEREDALYYLLYKESPTEEITQQIIEAYRSFEGKYDANGRYGFWGAKSSEERQQLLANSPYAYDAKIQPSPLPDQNGGPS